MRGPVIYYVRHGETAWNADKRLQGHTDIPLNERGRTQADRCGVLLADLFAREGLAAADLDYVSSPLGRARETMERVRTGLGLDPAQYRLDPLLMEMAFGRWEGLTIEELRLREAEGLAARERDRDGYVLPGGESYAQLLARVQNWHNGITRDIVVTAHGGVYRALAAHRGVETVASMRVGEVGQGVVYVLDHRGATLCE